MASSIDHLSNRMKLEWTSKLNTEMQPAKNYRRTSIICTIGKLSLLSFVSGLKAPLLVPQSSGCLGVFRNCLLSTMSIDLLCVRNVI